jgi:hypothetical protein
MSKVSNQLTSDKDKLITLHKIKQFIKVKPLKPQSHKIDKDKLKLFIDKTEELNNEYLNRDYVIKANINSIPPLDIRTDLTDFFNATQHISYRTFKFILEQNFKELLIYCKKNNITKINVLLPVSPDYSLKKFEGIYKQKSQYWLVQHLYQYIIKKKIKDIAIIPLLMFDNSIDDDSFVLVMDDASYSGLQITQYLVNYLSNVKAKKLTFYLLVTYISAQAKNRIIEGAFHNRYSPTSVSGLKSKKESQINKNHKFIVSSNMQIMKPLCAYLKPIQIYNIFRYNLEEYVLYDNKLFTYSARDIKLINKNFKNNYPIYFDHKLPDHLSSFPDIYSGIIPSIVNILRPTRTYIRYYPYHINFIENCKDLTEVNKATAKCPSPPYKEGFPFSKNDASSFSSKTFKTIKSYKSI